MRCLLFLVICLLFYNCKEERSDIPEVRQEKNLMKRGLDSNNYNVGLLIMDGTFNTELTAPMDIFHHTIFRDSIKPMNVFTVSKSLEAITTFEGLKILPDLSYQDTLPRIDILIIPAAEHNLDSDLEDKELIEFINSCGRKAEYVISHCDGAFLLAKTGLLDYSSSTTFPGDILAYREMFPHLDILEDVLWVHDGKYITSVGGAKSLEASLYLCEYLYGKKIADQLAEGMVVDWNLDSLKYTVK